MTVAFLDPLKIGRLRQSINQDAEFKLAARYMSEDVLFEVDKARSIVRVRNGEISEIKISYRRRIPCSRVNKPYIRACGGPCACQSNRHPVFVRIIALNI